MSFVSLVGGTASSTTGRWRAVRRMVTNMFLVGGLVLIGGVAVPSLAEGQSRMGATRVELETMRELVLSGSLEMSSKELMEIERRLSSGDFSVGDQITVQVTGVTALMGTFSVTPGPSLSFWTRQRPGFCLLLLPPHPEKPWLFSGYAGNSSGSMLIWIS